MPTNLSPTRPLDRALAARMLCDMSSRTKLAIAGVLFSLIVALAAVVWVKFAGPGLERQSETEEWGATSGQRVQPSGQMPGEGSPQSAIEGGALPPGCSCHSKNPRLVSMHQSFGVRDCNKCHKKGENLMEKKTAEMTAERKAELERRMREEQICKECHIKGRVIAGKTTKISGRLFCPKDQKTYSREQAVEKNGVYYCPVHADELIDVDKIAVESARKPKNDYCIACHPIDTALRELHRKPIETSRSIPIENCLGCHTSHSKCDGCHF